LGVVAGMSMTRREFVQAAVGALASGVAQGAGQEEGTYGATDAGSETLFLSDSLRRWNLGLHPGEGLTYFGLDSEGTGRERTNLLAAPVTLAWTNSDAPASHWEPTGANAWTCTIPTENREGALTWVISRDNDDLVWRLSYEGSATLAGLCLGLPFNALLAAVVLVPAGLDAHNRGLGPWLLVAPDFGHLRVEAESPNEWVASNDGSRGGTSHNAPQGGVDPRLRGQAWLDAVGLPDYRAGRLTLRLFCESPFPAGPLLTLRLCPQELSTPPGIDPTTWKRIRRPYLNHWQPCGTWCGPEREMVLANNVLSDPASCSLWFYAEPMLFCQEPVPGLNLQVLLRRSLDYWLDQGVSAQGHVNAFGKMYDLYVSCGACLLVAAWDYWSISRDVDWLRTRGPVLHRMADYLLRRDVDGDGLVESYGSGNAGTLRDPDRADIWFEMMNFGHKNTWTNALAYRAFLCLAEMLAAMEEPKGAVYYRQHAFRLREAFVRRFLSPASGWFVSWISQDGEVHDYCHTFVNGLAVAYGIVGPPQGREILSRVIARSKSIGFTHWDLGVPGNLIPCRKEDTIGPRIGIDGAPLKNDFSWPDELTEEEAFGNRYPNGTIHPALTWPYLLGLQEAGLNEEADRILNAMIASAERGLFQNGIVNVGYGGAEHFYANGRTCGYEGFLPESFNFLMGAFTRDVSMRARLLGPMMKFAGGPMDSTTAP